MTAKRLWPEAANSTNIIETHTDQDDVQSFTGNPERPQDARKHSQDTEILIKIEYRLFNSVGFYIHRK